MKMPRKGKSVSEQTLPSRHALNTITKGDPAQRTLGNYAKLSPATIPNDAPDILTPPGNDKRILT